jgi:hypothetical protein
MLFSLGCGIALVSYVVGLLAEIFGGHVSVLLQSDATNATLGACAIGLRLGLVLVACSVALHFARILP